MAKRKKKIIEKKILPQTLEEKRAKFKELARGQNKKAGESVVTFGSDLVNAIKIPTGIQEIDELLGGGIPNKIITVWGSPGCGKTTFALYYAAECQRRNKLVYYIALEEFEPERAEELGVNLEELMIGKFPKAEMCLDSIIEHAQAQSVDVIILDSIHSLSPEGEQEDKKGKKKSTGDDTMALLARKLTPFFRWVNHPLKTGGITLFLIGQTRTSLGFIALDTLSGGNALKHYSKLILHMRHGQGKNAPKKQCEDENGDGHTVKTGFECVVKIDKTQIAGTKMELTETRFPFYYNGGFIEKEPVDNVVLDEFEKVAENEAEVSKRAEDKVSNAELKEVKTIKKRGRPKKEKK